MNILFATTHLNTGGIARYVVNLAGMLKNRGNLVIVASYGGELECELKEAGISHIKLDINTKSELSPRTFASIFGLLKIIKENNIEIVHANTRVTQVAAFFASRIAKIPYVTTAHGFFKKRAGRVLFKFFGDKTIAISDSVKKDLIDKFSLKPSSIETIYTGIDVDRFRDFAGANKIDYKTKFNVTGSPVIGSIGRFTEEKGQMHLLRAFKSLLADFPNASLVLVGEGRLKEELVSFVESNGLKKNVHFLGLLKDTREALSMFDVFVIPSLKEGLGLAAIEAMASRVPVAASRTGGLKDIIEENKTGLFFEAGDEPGIKAILVKLLKDKNLSDAIRQKAGEFAKVNFSLTVMAQKIELFYKNTIKEI